MTQYNAQSCKRWYEKNRAKKIAYQKEYNKHHQEERKLNEKKRKGKITEIFGSKCSLCGWNNIRMELHEIYGNKHPHGNYCYALNHKEDFVLLCSPCHQMVTRMMFLFRFTWKQILALKVSQCQK